MTEIFGHAEFERAAASNMTTDQAAKAAVEILGFMNRSPRPTESPDIWDSIASGIAAIIRRHYEPRERLLERAFEVLRETEEDALQQMRWDRPGVAPDWYPIVRDWIADAASMGIGRTPE